MINVKLFVLLILGNVYVSNSENCEICPNHTLCKYPAGPSPECVAYDASAQLTRAEKVEIVGRVNEHRDRVARGHSRRLPPAANMRKMRWSEDLARAAQRWADQCHQATRPDNHDECRNMADTAVGQNIATIFGPAPGLSVKSFVDTWYMQILDYAESVTLYSQSDPKTNYFTQLIWAETDTIGCGKARFYIESRNTVVERLVCNFAPRGNILGKSVYIVGFEGTQCRGQEAPDRRFPGLCAPTTPVRNSAESPPVTSLLRILKVSNDSIKNALDPIRNEFKGDHLNVIDADQRNQKIRHVMNNSFAPGMSPFLLRPPPAWGVFNDSLRNPSHQYNHDRGHSRVYHGHDLRHSVQPLPSSMLNFRRYDYTTPPDPYATSNMRKFNQVKECTRIPGIPVNPDCNAAAPCVTNKCTRGQKNECCTPACGTAALTHGSPHQLCPCSMHTPCPHPSTCPPCCTPSQNTCTPYSTTKQCCQNNCPANQPWHCPKIGRRVEFSKDDGSKSPELHYYDLFPNLEVRSGDTTSQVAENANPLNKNIPPTNPLLDYEEKQIAPHNEKKYDASPGQVKKEYKQLKYPEEQHDYLYGVFDTNKRYKRDSDDYKQSTLWPLDEYNTVSPLKLKALRYTTLSRTKSIETIPSYRVTESITFKLRNLKSNKDFGDHSTEKFVLSFEELMRLRKSNSGNANARRNEARAIGATESTTRFIRRPHVADARGKQTEAVATTAEFLSKPITRKVEDGLQTAEIKKKKHKSKKKHRKKKEKRLNEYTAARRDDDDEEEEEEEETTLNTTPANYTINTQFSPVSHCTRRVTCTWTFMAMTATNSDGSIIVIDSGGHGGGGGGYGGGGSRTPPGYVEGCTRTSTCTRNYLERNRISTTPTTIAPEDITLEDEDYCEKRALEVRRRNSDDEDGVTEISVKSDFEPFNSDHHQENQNYDEDHTEVYEIRSTDSNNLVKRIDKALRYSRDESKSQVTRVKRDNKHYFSKNCKSNDCDDYKRLNNFNNPLMSYGDLYYLVLSKLVKSGEAKKSSHKSKKCSCNGKVVRLNCTTINIHLYLFFNGIIYVTYHNFV